MKKMKRKKSNVLHYTVVKVLETEGTKGKKAIVHQRRLSHLFLGIIPIWERDRKTGKKIKELILWRPDLKKHPKLINNDKIQNGDWLIMEKDFEVYSPLKSALKHKCLNKQLLQVLTNY